jgi:hypothetical protein
LHWGRDGHIYFAATDQGSYDLYRIDVDRTALSVAQ